MKKILIVDNNRSIVEMLAESLGASGYQIVKAYDGMEALDLIRKDAPDLIVLDLIMPKIDGFRLSRFLKNDPTFSDIPIIILSAVAAEDSQQMANVHADAFIAKGKLEQTFSHILTTIRWLEARKKPRKEILGLEDVYPREIARELLLVKQHFDSMLQVMGEGVLEMDEHHRIFFANQAACHLLGTDEIELFGKHIVELFHESPELPGYMNKLPASQKLGTPGIHLTARGRTLRFLATPFYFNQAYIGSIAVLEDVTAQLMKERALEELTEAIIQSAPIGIALLDTERHIVLANEHFHRLSGAKGSILKKQFFRLPHFSEPGFAEFISAASTGSTATPLFREVSFMAEPAGATKTYLVTASPLFRQEKLPFLLVLTLDITDKAELERRLVNANRELEAANQAKSNFLSIVSHELRTPLSVIRGYISLILDGKIKGIEGEALEALQTSDRRARHLQQLIEELLDLSRIEAGKIALKQDVVVPAKHVHEVVEMLAGDFERKKLQVEVSLPADLPDIVADHDKFHQVLANLVGNAIKFTLPGGRITITGKGVEKGVQIAVSDTGIGIASDKIPLIFNRFYQVDSTDTRVYGGAGLGLSIVQMILDAMGGGIEVESSPGRGSTFTVTLPRGRPDKVKKPAAPKPRAPEPEPESGTRRIILLCEDDEDTLKIVSRTLPEETYEVIVCRDCVEALRQAHSRAVDLAVVDIRLPIINGYDFCRMMRASEATRHIPLIIVSAAGQEEEIKKGYDTGADEYIIKPFSPRGLLERIEHQLQGLSPA